MKYTVYRSNVDYPLVCEGWSLEDILKHTPYVVRVCDDQNKVVWQRPFDGKSFASPVDTDSCIGIECAPEEGWASQW